MDIHPWLARDGLLLSSVVKAGAEDPGEVRAASRRGELIKLRRGVFVTATRWNDSSPRAQHLLRMRAVTALATSPPLFCGASAAAAWGMPIAGSWPAEVSILAGGGRGSGSGIRRSSLGVESVDRVVIDRVSVTSLARTALDVTRGESFLHAVGSVDWAFARLGSEEHARALLLAEILRMGPRARAGHLRRVVEFACGESDSFGESMARAAIWQAGFERPTLQAEFTDAVGLMRVDFFWRSAGVVVEFDGKQKYTRGQYTRGDPGEVVWQEKRREDRLRRLGLTVVRIGWVDLHDPVRLRTLLSTAHVPASR